MRIDKVETKNSFICSVCKETKIKNSKLATGYAVNDKKEKVCYMCCAIEDKKFMVKNGHIALYLCTNKDGKHTVTNWPDSLSFNCTGYKIGGHNIAGVRYDVWFVFDGYYWHGVTYGNNTQICHCKRTKQAA